MTQGYRLVGVDFDAAQQRLDHARAELAELQTRRAIAERDLRVDSQRSEEAYARKKVRRGRFYAQEARRDAMTIDHLDQRLRRLGNSHLTA